MKNIMFKKTFAFFFAEFQSLNYYFRILKHFKLKFCCSANIALVLAGANIVEPTQKLMVTPPAPHHHHQHPLITHKDIPPGVTNKQSFEDQEYCVCGVNNMLA